VTYVLFSFSICTVAQNQQGIFEDLDIISCDIDIAFTRIGCKLLSLLDGKVSAGMIKFACFSNANTELGIGYPDDLKQQLDAANTVTDLFVALANHPTHWSWINIQVMEKIASVNSQATKLVEYYKNVISAKKIQSILHKIPNFEIDEAFYCKVKKKYSKTLDELTIKDIQDHESHVSEFFSDNKTALILTNIFKRSVAGQLLTCGTSFEFTQLSTQWEEGIHLDHNCQPTPACLLPHTPQLIYVLKLCDTVEFVIRPLFSGHIFSRKLMQIY